jgi:hypothetical protein
MTGWERLGIGGLSQDYLSGRVSPSAVLDDALTALHGVHPDFGYLRIRSLVLPSNEHAIQRDPNEVIIGM